MPSAETAKSEARSILEIDRCINANVRHALRGVWLPPKTPAEWQALRDAKPAFDALDRELYRERAAVQREQDARKYEVFRRPTIAKAHPKKCPTCGQSRWEA